MYFELTSDYKIKKKAFKKSPTVVIDNGTYEMKAGYVGSEPQIVFKNHFYKEVDGIKFNGQRDKNRYSPFFNDMIAGFHCLEENIDQCLDYLKVKECQNLIITDAIYSPTKKELLKFLFEVYRFKKIQIGVDAIYSYLYNKQDPDCIVISLSHTASYVYLMIEGKIADVYKLCYGGKMACKYLSNVLKYKHREYSKDYSSLLTKLKVAVDYDKTSLGIYNKIRCGDCSDSIFIGSADDDVHEEESDEKEVVADTKAHSYKGEVGRQKLSDIAKTEGSEDKLTPGMYKIRLYQLCSKVEKHLKIIQKDIYRFEEIYEKKTDFTGFLNKKKQNYEKICRELEMREKMRRDSKNRKAYEFALLLKTGELTEEEQAYKKKIAEAEDLEVDDRLIAERNELLEDISYYDPLFSMSSSNTLDLLEGKNLNKTMVNIDLYRASEILFEPSIVGSNQMGISEILENILKRNKVTNIFITGGFSQIEGIKERIESEANKYSYNGPVSVFQAEDPPYDAFKGATFSDLFPVYTYSDYIKKGIDGIYKEE